MDCVHIYLSMEQIIKSVLTIPNTIIIALITWIVKSSYKKYVQEKIAISVFERALAQNLTILNDNIEFIEKWESALEKNIPFATHFSEMVIDDKSHFSLSDVGLVNKVLNVNYILIRTTCDLKNIYKEYRELVYSFRDKQVPPDEFTLSCQYHLGVLKLIRQGLITAVKPAVIETLAHIRLAGRVKKHTIYRYINALDVNIFPRITKTKLEKEMKILNDEFDKVVKKSGV